MNSIVFPEATQFVRQKLPQRAGMSLRQVIAVVYIFGGVSATIALLSRLVVEPLFYQLTIDRSEYATLARGLLTKLNARISSAVSYIPPLRSDLSGPRYTDSQTQTDPAEEENSWGVKSAAKQSEYHEISEKLDILALAAPVDDIGSLKHSLEEINTLIQSLSYPNIHTFSSVSAKVEKRPDILGNVKKEIRSVKGALLTA